MILPWGSVLDTDGMYLGSITPSVLGRTSLHVLHVGCHKKLE